MQRVRWPLRLDVRVATTLVQKRETSAAGFTAASYYLNAMLGAGGRYFELKARSFLVTGEKGGMHFGNLRAEEPGRSEARGMPR